jgi:hypothetical protein
MTASGTLARESMPALFVVCMVNIRQEGRGSTEGWRTDRKGKSRETRSRSRAWQDLDSRHISRYLLRHVRVFLSARRGRERGSRMFSGR